MRLTVLEKGDVRAQIAFPAKPGQNDALSYPLFLEAKGKMGYFEIREGFNFAMLYKNPMVRKIEPLTYVFC